MYAFLSSYNIELHVICWIDLQLLHGQKRILHSESVLTHLLPSFAVSSVSSSSSGLCIWLVSKYFFVVAFVLEFWGYTFLCSIALKICINNQPPTRDLLSTQTSGRRIIGCNISPQPLKHIQANEPLSWDHMVKKFQNEYSGIWMFLMVKTSSSFTPITYM